MSLRTVHILFIASALGLFAFLAYWSGHRVWSGENGVNMALLACSVVGGAAGLIYLPWFVKKTKSLR